jgi:stage III sporulation protein AF
MKEWLKLLVGTMCILTILLHLLPGGKYEGYVRFYAGLLFFLVAVGPVCRLLFGEGELERLLKLEFLKTEYYDTSTSVQAMTDLKNTAILDSYRKELKRQVVEIAAAYGMEVSDAVLYYDAQEEYQLTGMELTLEKSASVEALEQLKKELTDVFALEENEIHMINPEAAS